MKKQDQNPSGFGKLVNEMYGNPYETEGTTDIDNVTDPDHVEDIEKKDTIIEDPDHKDDSVDSNAGDSAAHDDQSQIPDDVKKDNTKDDPTKKDNPDNKQDNDNNSDLSDEQITEAQQVSALFEAVGESLGWDMEDIDENDIPVTVDDLTKYLGKVVEQNSVPHYADDRIQQLDEFVKNGGKFEDFYQAKQQELSLDNLDMEVEDNQKAVIKDLLKYNGYSDEQINNKLARYEEADMLYDESQDALDRLKTIRKQEFEQNQKQQEELAKAQREQQEQFFNTVTTDINQLDSIRGIQIPKADRKALYDYIFKVDKDGVSQYQKDFNKNLSKNLIESAYFTMKGDALVSDAKRTGETSAAEKLRKLMRHQTKNHTGSDSSEKQKSATDLLNGMF